MHLRQRETQTQISGEELRVLGETFRCVSYLSQTTGGKINKMGKERDSSSIGKGGTK